MPLIEVKHMKRINKSVCMLLTLILCMSLITNAHASEITPRYTYTTTISANISINSIGVATCHSYAITYDSSHTIKLYCYLQYKENDSWITLKYWTTSATECAALEKYYAVASGYEYRVRTVAYIYDSDGKYLENCAVAKQCSY